ncbi:hypothetical protein CRUP_010511, partial [Coryphaenoides rupestris]
MQRIYKKGAIENFCKYTHVVDRPELILARVAAANLSDKLYKQDWDEGKATGYQLNHEYIPLLSGKKGREIISNVKYKDSHEKAKGHYMANTLVDFPEVVRCGQQEKGKALRLYQKDYHQTKTKNHIPSDIANQVAKRCQDMLSDVMYRTYLHQWTCPPDQEEASRARKSNEILSDLKYKEEGKKEFNNYSIVTDTPLNYREAYHKEKHLYTTILDTHDYASCHDFKHFFSN